MEVQTVQIPLSESLSLEGDLYGGPDHVASKRLAIVCHGFTAHRRYMFLPFVGESLAAAGLPALLVDFSRCGVNCRSEKFEDFEGFSRNTFENGRQELVGAIRAICEERALPSFSIEKVSLVGHSHGGVGVLGAACDPQVQNYVESVSAWSTPSDIHPHRFGATDEQIAFWRESGEIPYPVERLGIEVPLKLEVLEDMEIDPYRVEKFTSAITCPLQVVHGAIDERIPPECGEKIVNWAFDGELNMIPGADHVFNVKFPESKPTEEVRAAVKCLLEFIS